MSASFRQGLFLLILSGLAALGCDDGSTPLEGDDGAVREKQQLALEGEACDDVTIFCDDSNPCTDDVCDVGGTDLCVMTDNTDPCDADASVCTQDVCSAGACTAGPTISCDDGEPCTDDSCDPVTGCESVADNNNTCTDDSNACTTVHFCLAGTCSGSTPPNCDDGEACTDDSCNPAVGCVNVSDDANTCDDGDNCTEDDECSGGTCGGTPKVCDTDPNDCQVFSCNSANGMCQSSNVSNGAICDDGDACTVTDLCQAGSCDGTGAPSCDDGNDCTSDACVSPGGCVNTDISASCGDGNACTADSCNPIGGCQNTDISASCNDGNACTTDSCNTTTGCSNVDISASCNDGNQCTADSCSPATGCVNDAAAMNTVACNDGSACNDGETCLAGACQGGAPRVCDDGNQCTSNTCNPASGCQYLTNMAGQSCTDGIACTDGDLCNSSGACVPGSLDHDACPDLECAVNLCTVGVGCVPTPALSDGNLCRAAAGPCDVAETCDGVSSTCPANDFLDSSTVCVNSSCASGTQTDQMNCTGDKAACDAPNVVDCQGFICDGGAPSVCLASCADDSDCLSTHFCDDASTCQPKLNPGGICTEDSQCDTANGDSCVDGRCCNSPCTGQCQACNVPGFLGQCVPIPDGGAPEPGGPVGATRSECTTDGSSCGGTCDGVNVSACAFPPSGTVCEAEACNASTNQAVEASVCNGLGACNAPAPVSCDPFVCDGDACRTTCTQDSHCDGNLQCIAGTCVDAFSNGSDCTVGSQCASGNCVDGVCCDSACGGQCEACNVAGEEGTCSAVSGDPVGSRPDCSGSGDCAGSCNGSNRTACVFPTNQVECREASCVDGVATIATTCNGGGICPGAQSVTCEEGCDGLLCANPECAVSADCEDGEVCRAGMCVPPDVDGTACSVGSDCESGNCVDGVCCDTACEGQCEACDVSGEVGTCSAVPEGGSPRGGRMACTTDGSICGGTCDGTTRDSCGYPTSGECRPGACDDGVATLSATCDGSGTCPIVQEQDCGTIVCDSAGEVCDGPCATDPDACAADEYCSAGICVALRESGVACGSDAQCESGNCVDGVCCNTACTEQCGACNVPGSLGTCTPVTGGVVGGRPACSGSGTCAAACDGEDVRACAFPGTDTRCSAESCDAGVERQAGHCGGDGTCVPGTEVACPTLLCNGNECATSCEEDDECLGELVCIEGACVEDPLIDAVDKGSCGCRLPGDPRPAPKGLPVLLLVPLAAFAWRRRRAFGATFR